MGGGTRPHRGDAEERRGREDPFEIRGNRRTRRGCGRCGKAHDGASWRAIGVWRKVWTSGTVLWTTGPRPPHESTGAAARRFSTTAPTPSPHLLHRVVHTVRDEAVKTSFWTVFLGIRPMRVDTLGGVARVPWRPRSRAHANAPQDENPRLRDVVDKWARAVDNEGAGSGSRTRQERLARTSATVLARSASSSRRSWIFLTAYSTVE